MTLPYKKLTVEQTHYRYTSQGEGDTIMLLHGFTGSSQTWESFVTLLKRDYHVITVDLPGHGGTTGVSSLSMQEVCRHLALILDHLNIEKCHLIGYSMGGRTALSFAIWYPRYIASLVLESASPGLRTEAERQARKAKDQQLAERILLDGIKQFVDFWEAIPLFDTQKSLPISVRETLRMERLHQTEVGLATSLTSIGTGAQPSWWDELSTLAIPVCLIVGSNDEKFVRINEQMEQQLPNVIRHIVQDAGHAVHLEQELEFLETVRHFIQLNIGGD